MLFNGLIILIALWASNKYLTDTEGLHNISSCHLLYRRQVILSSSTCVKICASSTDYFIMPGQQFPSVYTFRGGLKSGDGVEPNPGDAGCISQWSDGWACPLCFSTCLSAVTLNDHKGQICASSKIHPTLPLSPSPHYHPHTIVTVVFILSV